MSNIEEQKNNGYRWLHELCYGVEKSFQLNFLGMNIRKRPLEEIVEWGMGPEVRDIAIKLIATKSSLSRLLGTQLELIPLLESGDSAQPKPSTYGKLRAYDLIKASLSIKSDLGMYVLPFAVIENEPSQPGELEMVQVNPVATMHTEFPFK
jgi:hypothetical protein